MSIREAVERALRAPSTGDLRSLRGELLDELFAPLHSDETGGAYKAARTGVLSRLILMSHLSRALDRTSSEG